MWVFVCTDRVDNKFVYTCRHCHTLLWLLQLAAVAVMGIHRRIIQQKESLTHAAGSLTCFVLAVKKKT